MKHMIQALTLTTILLSSTAAAIIIQTPDGDTVVCTETASGIVVCW